MVFDTCSIFSCDYFFIFCIGNIHQNLSCCCHVHIQKQGFTRSTLAYLSAEFISQQQNLLYQRSRKSESAKYFAKNPEARKKKNAYNKAYHSTPERKKYRADLNKANRKAGTYGNGDKVDKSHTKSGKIVNESQSKNRSRNGKGSKSSKKQLS